jgi:Delta7-sterol 5-desaturase
MIVMFIKDLIWNNTSIIIFFILYKCLNINMPPFKYFIYTSFIFTIFKYILINMIDIFTKKNNNYIHDINFNTASKHLLLSSIISSYFITLSKYYLLSDCLTKLKFYEYIGYLIINFPIVFIYEIIYDLFFYISHYALHKNTFLYKNIHKHHHNYSNLHPYYTFYAHPLESIFCIEIPSLISILLVNYFFKLNFFTFVYIHFYRIFIEIYGHMGEGYDIDDKISILSYIGIYYSLVSKLSINITSNEHLLHHKILNNNFSKRFILYDKIFNTYKKFIK